MSGVEREYGINTLGCAGGEGKHLCSKAGTGFRWWFPGALCVVTPAGTAPQPRESPH